MKLKLHLFIAAAITLFTLVPLQSQLYNFETEVVGWHGSFNSSATYNATEDAMEYVRTHDNNSLKLAAPADPATIDATAKNYLRINYKNLGGATQLRFKATSGVDDNNTSMTISTTTGYEDIYFDLSDETAWDDASEGILLQFRVGYTEGEGAIFIKEIEFFTVSPSELEDFLGFESANDGEFGVMEPNANGNSTVTGWYIENNTHWAFDNTTVKTGLYSAKFDAAAGIGDKRMQGGGISAPANSKLDLATGDWYVTADVYIPAANTVPEYLKFYVKNPSNNFTITLADNLAKDQWHTVQSPTITVSSENIADGYNIISNGRDTNSLMYVDNIQFVDASTASSKDNRLENVSIYPNPATEIVHISTDIDSNISILNLAGQTVYSTQAKSTSTVITVSDINAGVYIVSITSEGKSYKSKLIIK